MKKKKSTWVNCLVKNEERWIWYALMSVINYVDKILVWDTGSTDKTVQIIKSIKNPKISFREYGSINPEIFPKVRQEMLEQSKSDWILILDGDEVWTNEAIKAVIEVINKRGNEAESIIVKTLNLIGDVYHYQEESAGQYQIAGRKGHLALRAINMRIPGLHVNLPYGKEGYFDKDNKPIQQRNSEKILFLPVSYFHMTHLPRTSSIDKEKEVPQRFRKRKYEIGIEFPKGTKYPEVFYQSRPEIVPDPWIKMEKIEFLRALIQTPFKNIKRSMTQ